MNYHSFFWLHIKKSAGQSTRNLLHPHYIEVDRSKKPKNFIQSQPEEYNDVLNNYRVVLGDYQFKRALFAKKYLYAENWNSIFSFAFSREPVSRCVSMFYYLHYKEKSSFEKIYQAAKSLKNQKKIGLSVSYDFDIFLELVEKAHFQSESNYSPAGLHFSAHTAPMFEDITDKEGNILLKKVYRLEQLNEGINQALEICGLTPVNSTESKIYRNKNDKKGTYQPTSLQNIKIAKLYPHDFELYENAIKSI